MKKKFIPIVALIILVVSCNSPKQYEESLDANRFSAFLDSLKDEQLLDVRTAEEFSGGHIMEALNIDWMGNNFAMSVSQLDKTRPVFVYCLSGGRSAQAAKYLREEGFKPVYELEKGLLNWNTKNLPLTDKVILKSSSEFTSEVSISAFQELIKSEDIVLVDFGAKWCTPCKILAPRLDELVKEMGDDFKLIKLDSDRDSKLAQSMNITSLPTLLLYKNGVVIWKNVGLIEKELIAQQINLAISK